MRSRLALLLIALSAATAQSAVAAPADAQRPPATTSVLVTLGGRASLIGLPRAHAARMAAVERELRARADVSQAPLLATLRRWRRLGLVTHVRRLWIVNAIAVTADPSVVASLRRQPNVVAVRDDAIDVVPAAGAGSGVEPNLSLIGAPDAWAGGDRGEGVVVASLDTGVDLDHPELAATWRGGAGGWFDPYGQHVSPTDVSGHGTHTMGVIVGGDASGSAVGVAPAATWIAARIFDDRGQATTSAIHQAFQWALDPDRDPATPDAPGVVNNSWSLTTSCNLEFEPDIQALRAIGVVPVFAAGNSGPTAGSSYSPADNPGALAVGATTNADQIAGDSSRGPSACGGIQRTYPDITAPGVGIRTTDLLAGYTMASGTSLAAPEVAGALALVLSAHRGLDAAAQEHALRSTAVDLGAAGPDNSFGDGRLDVAAALRSLTTDVEGPVVSGLIAVDGTLRASATDAMSPLAGAEWFLDSDPGNGSASPMAAADGRYDSPTEDLIAPLPELTAGHHLIGVRARDAAGNWGAPAVVEIDVAGPHVLFADGFASGDLARWTAVRGANRVEVLPAAALDAADGYGMRVTIAGRGGGGVLDGSPSAESAYTAQFRFDPGATNTHDRHWSVFAGRDAGGRTVFAVEFRSDAGHRFARATAAGARTTAWLPLPAGAVTLAIAWSSTSHSLSLATEGRTVRVAHLPNGGQRIDRVWLGPSAGLTAAARGRLQFDAFSSTADGPP